MTAGMEWTAYAFFFFLGAFLSLHIDRWLVDRDSRKAEEDRKALIISNRRR